MKLIDKLLIKARSERGRLYYLIGVVEPFNDGYDADIMLCKHGDVIERTTELFTNENKLKAHIDNIAVKYDLKSDDIIICFMDYGGK